MGHASRISSRRGRFFQARFMTQPRTFERRNFQYGDRARNVSRGGKKKPRVPCGPAARFLPRCEELVRDTSSEPAAPRAVGVHERHDRKTNARDVVDDGFHAWLP